ncbi:hypothetical protein C9374_009549 [Naegleria lovaniensis]|uniref:Uncharacterized protein n=1 Tax=Naegleria lovaniensis TaxID=51637 RepID=A0AA88H4W7_NAELO|nr:uncharacterized protein C9374_009549 [Naegleria lovaniensis]KAG2392972.1 hypothetical protein C9374_009549 [Naegleria lovaniensis]
MTNLQNYNDHATWITLIDLKTNIMSDVNDDTDSSDNSLFSKLKDKMRTQKKHGFAMNFKQVAMIPKVFSPRPVAMDDSNNNDTNPINETDDQDDDETEHSFRAPSDVKISYTHQVILVSDYSNMKIYFFKYLEKTYVGSIGVDYPMYMCIEEKYNGLHDALIFDSCSTLGTIFKFDLQQILRTRDTSTFSKTSFIWKNNDSKDPRGIALMRENGTNVLLVTEFTSNTVFLIHAQTGTTIQKFTNLPIESPYAIDVVDRTVMIGEYNYGSSIFIYTLDKSMHDNRMVYSLNLVKKFRKAGDDGCNESCQGLVFDPMTQYVVCTDTDCRIQVFTLDGHCVKSMDTRIDENNDNPDGLFIDEKTGELYLCSYYAACIRIYN